MTPNRQLFLAFGLCLVALSGLVATACDSANPVAPSGTFLSLTASPNNIGLNGSATITVIGRRPDGSALFEGTEIVLSTSLGSLDQTVIQVGDGGSAQTTLRGAGRSGTATVTATAGAGTGGGEGGGATMATTEVEIGVDEAGQTLTVSADPTQIGLNGSSTIRVVARRADGSPVAAGTEIRLVTTLGSLVPVVDTNANGIATATLSGNGLEGTATVTATIGNGEATGTADVQIGVEETGQTLTVSADPTQIDTTGTSTITVVARRSDGSVVAPGTEIRLTTNLGSIDPTAAADAAGIARATLRGSGVSGTATVTATIGNGESTGTVDVQIGDNENSRPVVILEANPDTIPVGTGESEIQVIARRPDGTPVAAGERVILTTSLGTLTNSRPSTDADGTATTILRAGGIGGIAMVSAIVGSSDQVSTPVTIQDFVASISLQASPSALDGTETEAVPVTLEAIVQNSAGQPARNVFITFESEYGTFTGNRRVQTNESGQATVTIEVVPDEVPESSFEVTASGTNANGQRVTDSATIVIN